MLELNDSRAAKSVFDASSTEKFPVKVLLCRNLDQCRRYVRENSDLFDERARILATGQGRRLRAEGIRPDVKPDIADWMLRPSTDIRSSNMLEEVQNQYQVQGLEIDHAMFVGTWILDVSRGTGHPTRLGVLNGCMLTRN